MQIDVHFVRMMLQYGKQLLKIYLFVYVLQWAHHYRRKPAKVMAVTARSIVDIVVADANKPIVLEHRYTIDDLVTGLLQVKCPYDHASALGAHVHVLRVHGASIVVPVGQLVRRGIEPQLTAVREEVAASPRLGAIDVRCDCSGLRSQGRAVRGNWRS